MKRILPLIALSVLVYSGCSSSSEVSCATNDVRGLNNPYQCDGVPDDLGYAYDADGEPGPDPWDFDGNGSIDGWAIDTDGDGKPDALGLDLNNDGYVDSVDTNFDQVADFITGMDGGNPNLPDGGGASNGGGNTATGGTDGGGATTATGGDAATGGGFNWGDIPELERGPWHAPIVEAARTNLNVEYTRWKNANMKSCDGGRASVSNGSGGVVSEGIGYGMLITASLGTQAEFDAIHLFYKTTTKSPGGLMAWKCNSDCGDCPPDNSASDGDLDVAMALLQAEVNFNGGGVYAEAAKGVIGNLRGSVVKDCGGKTAIVAGEWDPNCNSSNPSYHSPGYYRAFAQVDTLGAATWNKMADDAYDLLEASKSAGSNGLWPDGTGESCFACNGYDACRTPWRIATDYAWTGNARAAALLGHVSGRVDSVGMPGLATDPNSAFYGAFALSGLAGGQAKADSYYQTWINSNPLQDGSYYQGTLRVIYMMLAAGQFPSTLAE